MRGHTKSAHKMSISDYKEKFGNHRTQIIEKIYHECGLCHQVHEEIYNTFYIINISIMKAILLDSDDIAFHLKKNHNITHKDYNAKFMKLIKEEKSTSVKKPSKCFQKKVKVPSLNAAKTESSKDIMEEKNKSVFIEEVSETCDSLPEPEKESEKVEFNIDEPGPSSGRRLSDEERELNMMNLWKLQQNMLRKLHLDDDIDDTDHDEEEDLESSNFSRSL